MTVINKLIETQEFATLPAVAARILDFLEDEDADIRDIARLIESDPSLTLKLLRVANSPLYATRNEVNSIHEAIMKLGLNRLTNIVLGVSIFSKFLLSTRKDAKELVEKFWWHAAATGMVAKSLSTKINKFYKENEFIGGLLHDIGKLALIQYDTKAYQEVIQKVRKGASDIEAEEEVFEANHIEVGYEIAKLWKLPNDLAQIIKYQNIPGEAGEIKELVSVVRLADLLCEMWDAGFYEGIESISLYETEPWKILLAKVPMLKKLDMEIFTFELEQDFQQTSAFLNIIASDS